MPRKGMRSLCFNSKTPSFSQSRHSSPARTSISTPPRRSFSDAMIDQSIDAAAAIVMKWNPESSAYARVTSLFYENKREAQQFIKCVSDLQKAMHSLVAEDSSSERIVYAQSLMQIAMKRLQKEFYQILSMNRAHLDPESVSTRSSRASTRSSTSDYDDDDEIRVAGDSITEVEQVSSMVMADLRSIAECMISAGYAKECISIYKIIRKSIIDEGIYKLGVERLSSSQISKMDWEVVELRIKNWLDAVKISMRSLFAGERILCDHVFASSDSIRESCFADISKEGALLLFGFPEFVVKSKKSTEKMFRALDMYTAISENWPEIESIFAFESTAAVRSQAIASLIRLSESVVSMLSDVESTIQKDSSKSLIDGGGVHPLTIATMNCLSLLGDYSNILVDIFNTWSTPEKSSLPDSYLYSPDSDESSSPAISRRLAWLILVLLCKLDGKAKRYKDVSLSYLFLANNLQHIVSRVRTSNLQYLLGDDWVEKHEEKVGKFAAKYEQLAWGKVISSLPENPTEQEMSPEQAKMVFRNFSLSFQEAHRKQRWSVVPDTKLREEIIKPSIGSKIETVYRQFYDAYRSTLGDDRHARVFVKYAPEDVRNHLSGLFYGTIDMDFDIIVPLSSTSSPSSTSSSSRRRHWRFI